MGLDLGTLIRGFIDKEKAEAFLLEAIDGFVDSLAADLKVKAKEALDKAFHVNVPVGA